MNPLNLFLEFSAIDLELMLVSNHNYIVSIIKARLYYQLFLPIAKLVMAILAFLRLSILIVVLKVIFVKLEPTRHFGVPSEKN